MSSYQARIQAAVANGAIPAEPGGVTHVDVEHAQGCRSEEHTSELQSLMRISYAVFCLKKKKRTPDTNRVNTEKHLFSLSIDQKNKHIYINYIPKNNQTI